MDGLDGIGGGPLGCAESIREANMIKRRTLTLGLAGSGFAAPAGAQPTPPVGRLTVVNAHHTR